ncbi:hypothetical protein TNCV_2253611 [Trichonephila clavipes]|nr:hypothetical protein TNCV_2253611 [Trichonephila clavipes]
MKNGVDGLMQNGTHALHGNPTMTGGLITKRTLPDIQDRTRSVGPSTEMGLLSLVNTGFTNPGNPSEPSLFSALFLAIPISLSFFSTSGAHFRVSTGGHVPEVPE